MMYCCVYGSLSFFPLSDSSFTFVRLFLNHKHYESFYTQCFMFRKLLSKIVDLPFEPKSSILYRVTQIKFKRVVEFYVRTQHKIQLLVVILFGSHCIHYVCLSWKIMSYVHNFILLSKQVKPKKLPPEYSCVPFTSKAPCGLEIY